MQRQEIVRLVTDMIGGRPPQPPAAEIVEQRRTAARELVEIQKERAKVLPKYADHEERAKKKWETTKRDELEARNVYADALRASMGQSHAFDRRQSECERLLRESADPAIDEFIGELQAEHDRVRRESPSTWTEQVWTLRDGEQVREFSDREAQVAHLKRVREGIRAAEGLKLRADCDVVAEIRRIRETVDGSAE